jgi:hypothetical protein
MDGKTLLRLFLDALGDGEFYGDYSSSRKAYESLDWAANVFCREAMPILSEAVLTTVLSQQEYDLPPDFIELYARDRAGRQRILYSGGGQTRWPYRVTADKIFFSNITTAASTAPAAFAIVSAANAPDAVTGTASSDAAAAAGECRMYDSTKSFTSTNRVYPRDVVHNLTDGSSGYVLEVVDATHLDVALFDGTANDFSSGDSYRILPSSRSRIKLDRPAGVAGHSLRVPYYALCLPVFAEARAWRFAERTCRAIVAGAVSLFKRPVKDYIGAEAIGGEFYAEVQRVLAETDLSRGQARQASQPAPAIQDAGAGEERKAK